MAKPMAAAEYSRALERLGFSNRAFCKFIGVDERTGRKWLELDAVPRLVALFLRLALAHKLDQARLAKLLGE